MQLGIYTRRSRPEELEPNSHVGFKTATERQLHTCKPAAELKGWRSPAAIYCEAGVSGYIGKRRSEFEGLIAGLEAGVIKGLLTWKLDLVSRNRRDWNRLLTLAEERGIIAR